jgi:SAM-dependent methyltransferase
VNRVVEPELLDELPATDPRAIRARADLQRLNWWMNHAGILARELNPGPAPASTLRLTELGAGDGTLLLAVARRIGRRKVRARLVDQQPLVTEPTRRQFAALGWEIETAAADVFTELEQTETMCDVMMANLFLHHFPDPALRRLLALVARRTRRFIALEPRRGRAGWIASRLIGGIGCNAITRHDAVVSVRAGFAGAELSGLWPAAAGWRLTEQGAGLFSHRFIAERA